MALQKRKSIIGSHRIFAAVRLQTNMADYGEVQKLVLWLFLHYISKNKGISSPNVSKIVGGLPLDADPSVRFVLCNLNNYFLTKIWNYRRIRTDTDFTVSISAASYMCKSITD